MKNTMRALLAVLVLVLVVVNITQAEIPFLIDCQGRLVDDVGNPLSTNVDVSVSIHTDKTAGTQEYSEDIGLVPVQNGIYSFVFGTNSAALLLALTNAECWVELNVESQALSPRIRLVSTPYSLYARDAERLDGQDSGYYLPSNTWAISAAASITNAGSGMVISSAERSKLTELEAYTNAAQTAFDWGDHGGAGYITGAAATNSFVKKAGDTMSGALNLPAGGLVVGTTQLVVTASGCVGIGISSPTNALAVNGTVRAKEVIVTLNGWPDYVFEKDYKLMPLPEVERFIKSNGHLPGIPSAHEVASSGVRVGQTQADLLRKIEELTLHVIDLKKENSLLTQRLSTVESQMQKD
jgi:hypothetical protein